MINLENLAKIREMLVTKVTDEQFDIRVWLEERGCGSVGCAIGWAKFYYADNVGLDANSRIGHDYFTEKFLNISSASPIWRYLFDSSWARTKKTSRQDCIKRIDEVLKSKGKYTLRMKLKWWWYRG